MFLKNLITNKKKEQRDKFFYSATPSITYFVRHATSDLIFITNIHIDVENWLQDHIKFSYDIIKKGLFFKGIQFSDKCDYVSFKMRWS